MSDVTGSNAGWHLDPGDPTQYRYYDGTAWTTYTSPATTRAAALQPYPTSPYSAAAPARTQLSKTSMILSLVSIGSLIFGLLAPLAVAGLVTGIIASRREPELRTFWLTGIIVGAVIIVIMIVAVVAAVALYAMQH